MLLLNVQEEVMSNYMHNLTYVVHKHISIGWHAMHITCIPNCFYEAKYDTYCGGSAMPHTYVYMYVLHWHFNATVATLHCLLVNFSFFDLFVTFRQKKHRDKSFKLNDTGGKTHNVVEVFAAIVKNIILQFHFCLFACWKTCHYLPNHNQNNSWYGSPPVRIPNTNPKVSVAFK